MTGNRTRLWISAIVLAIVSSFLGATALVHWEMRSVDRLASEIATNTAPSIEHLADARAELRRLQGLLDDGDAIDLEAIAQSQRALHDRIETYLALPLLPEERAAWERVFHARATVDSVVTHVLDESRRGDASARARTLEGEVPVAVGELYDALTSSIRRNARHTLGFATHIQELRTRATTLALALDVACTLIAIGGIVLARRLMRDNAMLAERHARLVEERASEMEAFAGRVAHDILSPLGTAGLALELAAKTESPEKRAHVLSRGTAAVERIKRLVDGLLDFARAGGKPSADARTDLDSTIAELAVALEPAARRASAELTTKTAANAIVPCNPGVLTSLVSNLANNALKYLGDGPERRVEIRTRECGTAVRVEVVDTGPGIPPGLEATLFEPYARAPNARKPGIGLGLATVKRLAEAHGGRVGVESVPGRGSTFWFELPKAEENALGV